jgi:hypothetical protein
MNDASQIIPALSREEELILCCARTQFTPAVRERFQALIAGPLDWKRVADLAALHRLRPLLFKHFKAENRFELIPPDFAGPIQKHAAFTVARNMSITTELMKVLKLLRAENIEAIPFKGPVLALKTYSNLGLREFYDVDLLLRREDILRAKRVLQQIGYTSPPEQNEQHIDSQLGFDLTSADGKVRLELHWSFIQKWLSYNVDVDAVWKRAVSYELAGLPIRIIAREDLLLYLCAHGAKHHWERLFWIIDIAEIVRSEKNLEWDELFERATLQGSRRALTLGLHLAQSLLGAPIPKSDFEPAVTELGRQVGTWLLREEKRVTSGDWEETKFYLRAKDSFGDRLTYSTHLAKMFFGASDKDRAFVKLPRTLGFLYPAIRPVRWAVQRFTSETARRPVPSKPSQRAR